ncbi:MAG: hypothetical protein JOZ02_18070 [Acidobacteria bacterium]|nr:hypothetical protein [Acidobacteriota bacterium]
MRRFLSAVLAALALAASASALALAPLSQSSTGRLVGTVSDASGVVAGATVVVKDNQTGKEPERD